MSHIHALALLLPLPLVGQPEGARVELHKCWLVLQGDRAAKPPILVQQRVLVLSCISIAKYCKATELPNRQYLCSSAALAEGTPLDSSIHTMRARIIQAQS